VNQPPYLGKRKSAMIFPKVHKIKKLFSRDKNLKLLASENYLMLNLNHKEAYINTVSDT